MQICYIRTPEIRRRISQSMKKAWARRKAEMEDFVAWRNAERLPTTSIEVGVDDARQLPRYAPTSAEALAALLEGANLLSWVFDADAGRWRPQLPPQSAEGSGVAPAGE